MYDIVLLIVFQVVQIIFQTTFIFNIFSVFNFCSLKCVSNVLFLWSMLFFIRSVYRGIIERRWRRCDVTSWPWRLSGSPVPYMGPQRGRVGLVGGRKPDIGCCRQSSYVSVCSYSVTSEDTGRLRALVIRMCNIIITVIVFCRCEPAPACWCHCIRSDSRSVSPR